MSLAHVYTVAFEGMEAREVDVQVHIGQGASTGGVFNVVGLADKAVGESRERVRAALNAVGLALPYNRITVNLAPADLPKEGSHYDLPIALGLLAAMGVLPASEMAGYTAMGELSLDGRITAVAGVLPAAVATSAANRSLICPAACGSEAAWAGDARDHRRALADRARQSHEGRAGADAAGTETGDGHRLGSRSEGRERPGDGQARARDRGRRRTQHADDRAAGCGQIHTASSILHLMK